MRFSRLLGITISISLTLFAVDDPFVGTWKLNLERSTGPSGRRLYPSTMTIEAVPGGYLQKNPLRGDSAGLELKLDGKDYPRGDGISKEVGADSAGLRKINARTIESTMKHSGKQVATIKRVVSEDGRVLTRTTDGMDANGKKVHVVEVFDKQ